MKKNNLKSKLLQTTLALSLVLPASSLGTFMKIKKAYADSETPIESVYDTNDDSDLTPVDALDIMSTDEYSRLQLLESIFKGISSDSVQVKEILDNVHTNHYEMYDNNQELMFVININGKTIICPTQTLDSSNAYSAVASYLDMIDDTADISKFDYISLNDTLGNDVSVKMVDDKLVVDSNGNGEFDVTVCKVTSNKLEEISSDKDFDEYISSRKDINNIPDYALKAMNSVEEIPTVSYVDDKNVKVTIGNIEYVATPEEVNDNLYDIPFVELKLKYLLNNKTDNFVTMKIDITKLGVSKSYSISEGRPLEIIYPVATQENNDAVMVLYSSKKKAYVALAPTVSLSRDEMIRYFEDLYEQGKIVSNPYEKSNSDDIQWIAGVESSGSKFDTQLGTIKGTWDEDGNLHIITYGQALEVINTADGILKAQINPNLLSDDTPTYFNFGNLDYNVGEGSIVYSNAYDAQSEINPKVANEYMSNTLLGMYDTETGEYKDLASANAEEIKEALYNPNAQFNFGEVDEYGNQLSEGWVNMHTTQDSNLKRK